MRSQVVHIRACQAARSKQQQHAPRFPLTFLFLFLSNAWDPHRHLPPAGDHPFDEFVTELELPQKIADSVQIYGSFATKNFL
jgi:hypothetical protein